MNFALFSVHNGRRCGVNLMGLPVGGGRSANRFPCSAICQKMRLAVAESSGLARLNFWRTGLRKIPPERVIEQTAALAVGIPLRSFSDRETLFDHEGIVSVIAPLLVEDRNSAPPTVCNHVPNPLRIEGAGVSATLAA